MPILMTFFIGLPVKPLNSPERTRFAKSRMRPSTACTSATTSCPSTTSVAVAGSRSAVCSTARFSDTLMCSPRNIASRRAGTPDSSASSTSSAMVSSVTRFLE